MALVVAAALLVPSLAAAGPAARRAPVRRAPSSRTEHAPTYLSPITRGRRITGFRRSERAARGTRALRDGFRVTFGKTGPARELPYTTLWIPGHSLGWRSLAPAMKHFLGNRANGEVAAVFNAKDGRFHENRPRGRVLSDHEVAATKLVTVQFSNPVAGTEVKSREIASALRALKRAHGGAASSETLPVRVVTHSAGDIDFRVALLDRINPASEGIRIAGQVAVGPVYSGTWTGNLGGTPLGSLVGMRKAASELAENSPLLARLEANRGIIDRRINGPRWDIQVEGAPTLKLHGTPHLGNGDGFIQTRDTHRPGARTLVLRGLDPTVGNHLFQIMYPGSVKAIEGLLTER